MAENADGMRAIRNIFTINLGVKKNERVLVFTDLIREDESVTVKEREKRNSLREIARDTADAGKEFCHATYLEFPSVGGHGQEPPTEVWEAAFGKKAVAELSGSGVLINVLLKEATRDELKTTEEAVIKHAKSPDAIIALSNYSTSHTRFRDFLTRCMGVRYASMPLFERPMLHGAMTADWKEVEARTKRLVELMKGGDMAYVTSRNGTSISFSIAGRDLRPDTGIITEKGAFGNLPAGEGFLAPVEGTAEGNMVLEWADEERLKKPICLEVRKGRVVDVEGEGGFAEALRKKIEANPLIGNIAELGIGTNDRAKRPDNILETEKILGTVHMALGDNSSFGGSVTVPYHQDFIFFEPTLEVIRDGEKVEVIVEGEPRF
ncbi:MAG: aminopeptidase [Deltaproteobacteria bacterium]